MLALRSEFPITERHMSPRLVIPAAAALLILSGCTPERAGEPTRLATASVTVAAFFSDWSEPVAFPPGINTASAEQNAVLSRDGLSLYFSSLRPGGMGGLDIYIAHRETLDSPWGAPVNAGTTINTTTNDFAPSLSIDGHLLFFASGRPGGQGGADLYVARRGNPHDDFAWQDVTGLGTDVNSAFNELAPFYLQNAEEGTGNLYFNRDLPAVSGDLHRAAIRRDGTTVGPAEPVTEVNSIANDAAATIRFDGKELFFWSPRAGGEGGNDLWTATRQNVNDPWSTPVNVGSLNTTTSDATPSLSHDGLTLIFASARPGGLGGQDIYYAMRTRITP